MSDKILVYLTRMGWACLDHKVKGSCVISAQVTAGATFLICFDSIFF